MLATTAARAVGPIPVTRRPLESATEIHRSADFRRRTSASTPARSATSRKQTAPAIGSQRVPSQGFIAENVGEGRDSFPVTRHRYPAVSPAALTRSRRSPTDADVADGPAFRSDPRSRPDQSTGYWLKNVFSTRAMSSGATTCPCPSSVCRSVWGMAAVIAFAARSKKSVGRPAIWGSVIGPSVVTRTD
jgi:hypothetical protein